MKPSILLMLESYCILITFKIVVIVDAWDIIFKANGFIFSQTHTHTHTHSFC